MVSSGAKLVPTVAFVACEAPESQRHNIILVMTDDQGIGDLGVMENPVIDTPNLDRLARRGGGDDDVLCQPRMCAHARNAE